VVCGFPFEKWVRIHVQQHATTRHRSVTGAVSASIYRIRSDCSRRFSQTTASSVF
jgi:hypothetical protein